MKIIRIVSAGLLTATLFAGAATSQTSPVELVWTYDDGGLKWKPEYVSLGNFGTAVFSHTSLNNTRAMLFSRHDSNPPTAVWKYTTNPDEGWGGASAEEADCHVAFTRTPTGVINENEWRLKKYSSAGLDWTYLAPFKSAGRCFVGVGRYGGPIVTAIGNPTTGLNEVSVFGPDSSTPLIQYSLPAGTIWAGALSRDGSTLALGIGDVAHVVDVFLGTVLFTFDNGQHYSGLGMDLSGDGKVFVTGAGAGAARVFEWNGSTYGETLNHVWPGGGQASAVAISDDASTVAIGFGGALYPSSTARLDIIDLPTKKVLASEEMYSFGLWPNTPVALDITPDGSRIAFAIAGDQPELWDELRLYDRDVGTPFATVALPGSPYSIDMSPDGKWLAVGNKPVHISESGSGGSIRLYRIGDFDLDMHGTPSLGSSPTIELESSPGDAAWLLISPSALAAPLPISTIGELIVNPIGAVQMAFPAVPPSGTTSLTLAMPNDPGLIGASVWVQGLHTPPLTLTGQAFPIVLLP